MPEKPLPLIRAVVDYLIDNSIAEKAKKVSQNDFCVTFFVSLPQIAKTPCRLSVVITTEMRTHLVFVTPSTGHFLLDITEFMSKGFAIDVVDRWIEVAAELSARVKSPFWEHSDWDCLEAEYNG